jgi:F-box protein 11
MSYVRYDDKYENGGITKFRECLSAAVKVHTGEEFKIFQDREDIEWGQSWKENIEGSLDNVTFFIPIITPGFFKSDNCREELERFIKREKSLKRNDLILPVYYVRTPLIDDKTKRATDELAQVIAAHQLADWRELKYKSFNSPKVRKVLEKLAIQIRDAIDRVQAVPPEPPPPAGRS